MDRSTKAVSRLIVPSIFFSILFGALAISSVLPSVNLAAGATAIAILTNLYYRNRLAIRLLGITFFLASCYFALALAGDCFNGEANARNYFDLALIIASAILSVLMIMGPKNPIEQH